MPYNAHFGIYVDVAMTVEDKSKSLLPFLSKPKLLHDESESEFQSGLQSLLSELKNPSPLAVALVSQLNECLWWIKRHTVDKELLLHEAMGRPLSREGSNWSGSGNSKLSLALEHYLDGNAHKDEVDFIDQALTEANLTMYERWQLFLRSCKGRSGARVGRYPAALRILIN
jgi:hypothetical protein